LFTILNKNSPQINKSTQKRTIPFAINKKENYCLLNKYRLSIRFLNPFFFLIGGTSENTNRQLLTQVIFSKNNIEIFNWTRVRAKLLHFHAAMRWLHIAKMDLFFRKSIKFMFASITPVFAGLMRWAAFITSGFNSSNRWLSGNITAFIKIPSLPHYLFIPDIDENQMIVLEACRKNIPLLAITNTDVAFVPAVPILGNSKDFRAVGQILRFIVQLVKRKQKKIDKSIYELYEVEKWFKLVKKLTIKWKCEPLVCLLQQILWKAN
jgi:hypothetical protein